ncbi:MFS transporter [uncultured Parasphingorhabdus sp.]|uniref:MFS transporter n=1 Tax=uncultured Parasphingorhabdus sp. TaxID=2709694 RepID=UPI002AA7D76E|nr:MFS transporter [uncultured Parasphingorhabdus sp.]
MVDIEQNQKSSGTCKSASDTRTASSKAVHGVLPENDSIEVLATGRTETSSVPQKLDLKISIGWAIGSLGTSTLLYLVSSLYLKFIVDNLLITASLAATIIAVTRLFDAAIDPLMGSLSDRTQSRWGRRRPYLLLGGVLCSISLILLFSDPLSLAAINPPVYVSITLCLYAIAYTIFNVPYIAMSYELTDNKKQRTWLMSYRLYAIGVAGIIAQGLAPWIVTVGGGGMQGFALVGWVMSVIVLGSCLTAFFMTSNARVIPLKATATRPRLRDMGKAFQNKPFRRLIFAKCSYLLGTGVQIAALAFFITVALATELSILGIVSGSLLTSLIVSQPIWVWICNRIGKRDTFFIAVPLSVLASLSWFLAGPGESYVGFILRGVLLGLGGGGMQLVIQAMLPDVMEYESERTNVPQEGVLAGVFTTVERGVSALAVAIAGLTMGLGGYVAGQQVQSDSAIMSLYVCVAIFPCLGTIGAALILRGYTLRS